jgi:hydrogenase maturation protease
MKKPVLILGIGNYLMGDEGIGVHLAQTLADDPIAEQIDVIDGGTGGFHLLEFFEQYHHVILVDATLGTGKVGDIRLIKPRFATDFPRAMSTHDIGLRDLIAALQWLERMPEIHLFVVNIESLQQQGIELTPEIELTFPRLLDEIKTLAYRISKTEMQMV